MLRGLKHVPCEQSWREMGLEKRFAGGAVTALRTKFRLSAETSRRRRNSPANPGERLRTGEHWSRDPDWLENPVHGDLRVNWTESTTAVNAGFRQARFPAPTSSSYVK